MTAPLEPPLGRQRPLPPLDSPPPPHPEGTRSSLPAPWIHTRRAWRLSRYLGRRELDLFLRARSARDLPYGYRCRLTAMGLPGDAVAATLRSIRSLAGWPVAWTATAQRFLGETRRPDATDDDRDPVLARARQRAACCYHVAHWFAYDDPRAIRTMRANAVALFTRSAPALLPDLQPVRVPWRGKDLSGYLRLPDSRDAPLPLVALLNGVTTSKEEVSLWAGAFLARGLAVLAFDQPGTGEAADLGRPSADHDDLSDAVLDFATLRPELDERRVALAGVSLGGTQAVLAAAHDRRIAAVVAVTPPFDPRDWLPYVNSVVLDQVAGFAGGESALPFVVEEFSLAGVAARLRCPLLVVGAGRDIVVPPAEAVRLAAEAGDLATLLWYGVAGHGLYESIPWWTSDAAAWLGAVFGLPEPVVAAGAVSTRVDPGGVGTGSSAGAASPPVAGPAANPPGAAPADSAEAADEVARPERAAGS